MSQRKLLLTFVGMVVFLMMSGSELLSASDSMKLDVERYKQLFLETSPEEQKVFSPSQVAEICSRLLEDSKKLPVNIRAAVFAHRGFAFAESNEPFKAKADYEEALRLEPDNCIWKLDYAYVLIDCNDGKSARALLKELVEKEPGISAKAMTFLAILSVAEKDLNGAIEWATNSIKKKITDPHAYYVRAQVYGKQSKWSECLADINTYLEFRPQGTRSNPEHAYVIKATALLNSGRAADSRNVAELALRINRTSVDAKRLLIASCCVLKQDRTALCLARDFVEANPKSVEAKDLLIRCLLLNEDWAEAKLLIDRLLKDNPKNLSALIRSAELALMENKHEIAVDRFLEANHLDPEDTYVIVSLIRVFACSSNQTVQSKAKAMKYAQQFLTQSEKLPPHYKLAVAIACLANGDHRQAEGIISEVKKADLASSVKDEAIAVEKACSTKSSYQLRFHVQYLRYCYEHP